MLYMTSLELIVTTLYITSLELIYLTTGSLSLLSTLIQFSLPILPTSGDHKSDLFL